MSHYLVNTVGLVIGRACLYGHRGWGFMPFTTARRASRKPWPTKEAAAKRYTHPGSVWIEASSVNEANHKWNELQDKNRANLTGQPQIKAD